MARKKNIAISEPNYVALKKLGYVGDSFDDVVSEILNKIHHHNTRTTVKHDDAITSTIRDSERGLGHD